MTFTSFENNFVNVLNQQAPKKSKVFCGNQKPHLNKPLRTPIMKLKKKLKITNKSQLPADSSKYKKQRNLVVKLNKKHKKIILMWLLTRNLFGISVSRIFQVSTQKVTLALC